MKTPPVVELTLPVLPDMELAATKTAEVVTKHMGLDEEKSAEYRLLFSGQSEDKVVHRLAYLLIQRQTVLDSRF